MDSATLRCCRLRKRRIMYYVYIIIGLWTILLCIGHAFVGRPNKQVAVKVEYHATKDMFDKWYSQKNTALDSPGKLIQLADAPAKDKKQEDITFFYNPANPATLNKVAAILGTFALGDDPKIPNLDCMSIMQGNQDAIDHGKLASLQLKSKHFEKEREVIRPSSESLVELSKDCANFRKVRRYITLPLSKEEAAFPIAYIITIHKDLEMFERLLRTIYHPQNLYCVHIDLKSDSAFKQSVKGILDCFDNVFMALNLTSVRYTHYSRVQADINCMGDLVKRVNQYPWRYLINLCGQDFPLKTNLEIVRSLKSLHGFNNLESVVTPEHKKRRFQLHFELPSELKNDHQLMVRTSKEKSPPPNNVEIFAGSAYYIFKRQAIEYIMTDPFIQTFLKWCEDTYSPDELLWATIQRMFPQVPGSLPPHEKYDLNELQSVTRLVKWGGLDKKVYPKCDGKFVRGVCVYGCGDLAWLVNQKHLFANKFDPSIDFMAIYCLENWLRNRTLEHSYSYLTRGYL